MKGLRKKQDPVEYWKSLSDIMTVLALVLIVIIFLVFGMLLQKQEPAKDEADFPTHSQNGAGGSTDNKGNDDGKIHEKPKESGGGSGGGEQGIGDYTEEPTKIVAGDNTISAVHVSVVDGETKKIIAQAGIEFNLYTKDKTLKKLSTYYPTKITYDRYETTESGTFYLPQKVEYGTYYLNMLEPPKGYDDAGMNSFSVNNRHDWDDPYEVSYEVYPSKNTIEIYNFDSSTREGISGAVYDVVAAEDIITDDGTVRAKKGNTIDEISVDSHGYGSSKELYLGKYELVQKVIPRYYAGTERVTVTLDRGKKNTTSQTVEIAQNLTKLTLSVSDELRTNELIYEKKYSLFNSQGDFIKEYSTGEIGVVQVSQLEKDMTYFLRGENNENEEYSFYVDKEGKINNVGQYTGKLYVRKLRVCIRVVDAVFGYAVKDYNMVLVDDNNQQIDQWTSQAQGTLIEEIAAGDYRLRGMNNKNYFGLNKDKSIVVYDKKDIQNITYNVFTLWTILELAVIAIALLLFIFVIIRIYNKRRKRKKE